MQFKRVCFRDQRLRGGENMKKSIKIALVLGALALVLGFGLVGKIVPLVDPPYGFINLK